MPISRKSPAVTRTEIGKAQWCLLGKNRLICSDATNPVVASTRMGNDRAHMAFTDPPYNVNYANSAKDKMRDTHRPILNDNPGEDFADFLSAACTCLLQYTQGAICIAMSFSELGIPQQAFRQAGGK